MAQLNVNAVLLDQNGKQLFMFAMNSAVLKQICYVTPRSKDAPDEIQRLVDPKRAKQIGSYVREATSLLPNALIVNLTSEVKVSPTAVETVKTLTFPTDTGKFAYILDGQHRLEGFKYSDGVEFDLPVVALYDADETLRVKVFADINSKQVKVTDVQIAALNYQIKAMTADEAPVMEVILRLNTDPDSPLRGRIKVRDDNRQTWVKNTALMKWLSPHLTVGGVLAAKKTDEKARVVKEYFNAVKATWPEAWGNLKDFNICKPFGFELIIGVMAQVLHRCDLNESFVYNAKTIAKQIKPLRNATLALPEPIGALELNWRTGIMGMLSNAATRARLTKLLVDTLRKADHEDVEGND